MNFFQVVFVMPSKLVVLTSQRLMSEFFIIFPPIIILFLIFNLSWTLIIEFSWVNWHSLVSLLIIIFSKITKVYPKSSTKFLKRIWPLVTVNDRSILLCHILTHVFCSWADIKICAWSICLGSVQSRLVVVN